MLKYIYIFFFHIKFSKNWSNQNIRSTKKPQKIKINNHNTANWPVTIRQTVIENKEGTSCHADNIFSIKSNWESSLLNSLSLLLFYVIWFVSRYVALFPKNVSKLSSLLVEDINNKNFTTFCATDYDKIINCTKIGYGIILQ